MFSKKDSMIVFPLAKRYWWVTLYSNTFFFFEVGLCLKCFQTPSQSLLCYSAR